MNVKCLVVVGIVVILLAGASEVWAHAQIIVTRERSKPQTVEIKAGEEVFWVNRSGGKAHVSFDPAKALGFYIRPGGVRVKFDAPGTYGYTVHISGTKVRAHTGAVVVK